MLPLLSLIILGANHQSAGAKPDFAVKVIGHGPPAILIPGLMCGPGVWDSTVDHLKDRFTCYVLTLPGFAGQAPIKAPLLSKVRDEIEAFVVDNKLSQPLLVGHSLGGMLCLWLASDKPALFGPVVSVDGVPALEWLSDPSQTPTAMLQAATALRKRYGAMDAAALADSNASMLPLLITDPKDVSSLLPDADRSDPPTVGEAIAEMLETDLRPEIGKVTQPLLVVAPGGSASSAPALDAVKAKYEAQFRDAPEHQIVVAPKSKHFVMLDAPDFFLSHLDEFLARIIRRG